MSASRSRSASCQTYARLIEAIPQEDWTPIPCTALDDGAAVAETTYAATFLLMEDATAVRLIVRRVQPTSGSQLALFVHYSYHAFIADRAGEMMELEADHRRHAEIENAIRDVKYGVGLNPSSRGPIRRQRSLARGASDRTDLRPLDGAGQGLGVGSVMARHVQAALLRPRRTAHPLGTALDLGTSRSAWPWAEQLAAALVRLRALPLPA